jgi:hypothetical protein
MARFATHRGIGQLMIGLNRPAHGSGHMRKLHPFHQYSRHHQRHIAAACARSSDEGFRCSFQMGTLGNGIACNPGRDPHGREPLYLSG